jgi:2-keto-3-deoxy-L-rhamnonate aldolase RhmA
MYHEREPSLPRDPGADNLRGIEMSNLSLGLSVLTFAGAALVHASENPFLALPGSGKAVFGAFSGGKTKEDAVKLSSEDDLDFVFYDMETGPFDIGGMREFMAVLGPRPVAARLPPVGEGAEAARERAKLLREAGVAAVVFPHVMNEEQAELAVAAMGEGPEKTPSILIIEDRMGVANAREIVSTPGVDIVFPGPGDLRRAYNNDAAAVEGAIQRVLAACKEFHVVCGITAGPEDIEKRLKEGFRVFIVTNLDALPVGRRAASR